MFKLQKRIHFLGQEWSTRTAAVISLIFLLIKAANGLISQLEANNPYSGGMLEAIAGNPLDIPSTDGGGPLPVYVGFYVESMDSIKTSVMSYDLDIYLFVSWLDQNRRHNGSQHLIRNDLATLQTTWVPDLYFPNAKTAYFQYVTVPNYALYIDPDGTMSYSVRVTLSVACNLDLIKYPFDEQICYLKIASYANTRDRMSVHWLPNMSVEVNPEIDLPEYYLTHTGSGHCNGLFEYAQTIKGAKRGNFSCLRGEFGLKRAVGYHVVQSYIPTGLIVIISWISFWIDRNAVPARISLTFTTLLTITTMGAGLRFSLPAVSYAKSIDYWYGACTLFVTAALLEFAIVNSFQRRSKKRHATSVYKKGVKKPAKKETNEQLVEEEEEVRVEEKRDEVEGRIFASRALNIDKACRFAFPLTFLLFNIVYWTVYLT